MLTALANRIDRRGPGIWWLDGESWYPGATLYGLSDFHCYRTLGLVRLEVTEDRATLVFDLDSVRQVALDAAISFLPGRLGPVLLEYHKTVWASEAHSSGAAAAERMRGLLAFRGVEVPRCTKILPLPIEELRDRESVLPKALEQWRVSPDVDAWRASDLGQHGLIFAPGETDLGFAWIGAQAKARDILGQTWAEQAIGTPCHAGFADRAFDRRVSGSYYKALERREPLYENVLGFAGERLIPYRRLHLPFEGKGGTWLAVFTQIVNPEDIAIPFCQAPLASASRCAAVE